MLTGFACMLRSKSPVVPGSGISWPIQAPEQTGLSPKRGEGSALIGPPAPTGPHLPGSTMPLGAGSTDGPIRCYAACDGTSPAGGALLLARVEASGIEVTACALRARENCRLVRLWKKWRAVDDFHGSPLVVLPLATASRRILHARVASRLVDSAVDPALW